jgi:hypothetical protein
VAHPLGLTPLIGELFFFRYSLYIHSVNIVKQL